MVAHRTLVDVTDLIEFLERKESASGVQRVVAEVAPLLTREVMAECVILDRSRGVFVPLTQDEHEVLIEEGARAHTTASRDDVANTATTALQRSRNAEPALIDSDTVLVFLGALWINDALMMAARYAHSQGAKIVSLLYDLTPVREEGHTAAVNRLFDRYLTLLMQTASAVPAISQSSRHDFVTHATANGYAAPPGTATGLPCGLTPQGRDLSTKPWPRPYALFVGTVESRKNHALAFEVWRELIERHGADQVPDLVCIGRLGWHASDFLRSYVTTRGLKGKVSLLTNSVADDELARFYAHAEFTVYPSRYEGWGLPVSESLAFGKVSVVADNSSLREAGGDLCVYFTSNDAAAMVRAIEKDVLDADTKSQWEDRIRSHQAAVTSWEDVAGAITKDLGDLQERGAVFPDVELDREYMLSVEQPPPDEGYADQFLDHLIRESLTPMLRQPRGDFDAAVIDAAIVGQFGSPQTWGYEIHPGCSVTFRFTRPVDGPLRVLISTRSMPGTASIEATGPGGPEFTQVYLGSVITLVVGDGRAGEPAQVRMSITEATDSIEGFLGIRSFVVVADSDTETQIAALEASNEALRQELDFIQGTRSWKVTAPLRKWKGRGA